MAFFGFSRIDVLCVSDSYQDAEITEEELNYLVAEVQRLQALTERVCRGRIGAERP
ncbi:hypothetical protein [Vibrio spartinae]|uniref:hypothetical protein n=1 Tax=Vibrio spartinae TaxID=1918945 RepID=UPI00135665CD|nr:hypothetical protein [Vibrio spartinae]